MDISATGQRKLSSAAIDAAIEPLRPPMGGVAVRRHALPHTEDAKLARELGTRMLSPAADALGLSRMVGSACACMQCALLV